MASEPASPPATPGRRRRTRPPSRLAGSPSPGRTTLAHVATAAGAVVDRLAVSKALTAIAPEHPELVAARALGVPVEAWQQLVADVAATTGQTLVAVAGTHGKSTTTGWLLHVLAEAGRDPSGFVGALLAAEDPAQPAVDRASRTGRHPRRRGR